MKGASASREVHIGKVVRDALLFNFKNPQGGTVSDSALFDAVNRLFTLLEERRIDYLLVGGIAVLQYVEGRNTEDIGFIMALSSLGELSEIRQVGQDGDDFARGLFDGLVEREIPCATPEGLVLLKLYALPSLYRQGNFARVALYETDILTLMQRYGIGPEPLFAELKDHLSPTDLEALRKITDEIRQRIARFGQEFA